MEIVRDLGHIDTLRAFLAQDGSILTLRAALFLFAVLAAFAWLRRRPLLALCLTSAGAVFGLGWWLVQIVFPLGLGTDAALTRNWAQAGVDALANADGSGFVWGTSPERSLVSMLALVGTPLPVVHQVPQVAALLGLGLLIMFPLALIKDSTTARFAACLVVGGGLWPGVSPYGATLLQPAVLGTVGGTLLVVFVLARKREARRRFNHSRLGVTGGLLAAAALGRAWGDGAEPGAVSAFLLIAASLVLASPVRVLLRRASARTARRNEALFLLSAFCGSGLFWWDPPKSVPGFVEATDESTALQKPLAWIAQNVPVGDVVLTSPAYAAPVAALAGRRVLFPPPAEGGASVSLSQPFRRARLAESTFRGQPLALLADAFSVTHLFLGPGEPSPSTVMGTDPGDEGRLSLVLAYADAEDFRVFRLTKK